MIRPARPTALLLPAALLAALASPGAAQVRLVPQVGLFAPASELPSPSEAIDIGKRESSLAFGLALELGPGLRLAVLHGTEGEVPIDGIGCSDCARNTVSAATASLVIRPLPEILRVRPHLIVGGGVKRYDFTRDDLEDEGLRAILSDANDLTGHFGAGAEVNLGAVNLMVEVQDLLSRFGAEDVASETQHDLFFTVGVAIGGR